MKPPSIYDYPPFDGSDGYAVYAGTAGGVKYPIVRVLSSTLYTMLHAEKIWHYQEGEVVETDYTVGTGNDIAAEIITAAALEMTASSQYAATLTAEQISSRIMPV